MYIAVCLLPGLISRSRGIWLDRNRVIHTSPIDWSLFEKTILNFPAPAQGNWLWTRLSVHIDEVWISALCTNSYYSQYLGIKCDGKCIILEDFLTKFDSSHSAQIWRVFASCSRFVPGGWTLVPKRYLSTFLLFLY